MAGATGRGRHRAHDALVSDAPRPHFITVLGGTGGCGVTTIALHLARALAAIGPACFVELSHTAGAAERMGLERTAVRTWSSEHRSAQDVRLSAVPMEGGFRAIFAAPSCHLEWADLALLDGEFDRVVVDPGVAPVNSFDGTAVVVVAGSLPAARRARPLIATEPARALVVNRTGPGGEATRALIEAALDATTALELPHFPALRDAEDEGRLLRRGSRWCRRIDRLARAIANDLVRS